MKSRLLDIAGYFMLALVIYTPVDAAIHWTTHQRGRPHFTHVLGMSLASTFFYWATTRRRK